MHPELFSVPDNIPWLGGVRVTTYGFCMMVGFLTAVWFAMKRASRVKADADEVLNLAMIALFAGVAGARAFFVVHYWRSEFADHPNPLFAALDLREGGLEFLGGFLGAAVALVAYIKIRKLSIRMYLDILAPAVMLGLAFGRIGCFFNGCCFGGVCTLPDSDQARYPWAVQFPFAGAAEFRQWEDRQVTLPAELIPTFKQRLESRPIRAELLSMSPERLYGPSRAVRLKAKELKDAQQAKLEPEALAQIGTELDEIKGVFEAHELKHHTYMLAAAQAFPSRIHPERGTSISELQRLAQRASSLPVHPTQIYSSINAFILYFVLVAIFYVRKRHGLVIGLVFVLYPISRTLMEIIRTDNPHHAGGFTASQLVSAAMFAAGLIYLFILYRYMPIRSPYAVAFVPPEEER